MELWDEAERNLRARGMVSPPRRQHSRAGDNGCTHDTAGDCPACIAHARAQSVYREALFAEMARLRSERSLQRG